jgi:hypothetical protein
MSIPKFPLAAAVCALAALLTASAAQACPTTALAPEALTGFEHARKGYSNDNFVPSGTGVSIDTAAARSGGASLRVAAAGVPGNEWRLWQTQMTRTGSTRVAVRLDSLPAADVTQLLALDTAYHAPRSAARVGYDAATGRLKLTLQSASGNATTVLAAQNAVAGAWHVIELAYDVSSATHAAKWRIDGVEQDAASVAAAGAEHLYRIELGTNTSDRFVANYDDVIMTTSASNYPLGDGAVHVLKPNGMGKSAGAANLRDDDGTAIDALSWTRLDEIPALSTTDFVQQVKASATSYAEIAFEDTAATCIRAVRAYYTTHSVATNNASHAKLSVFDGAREMVVDNGDWAANVAVSRDYSTSLMPASGWSQSAVNGLVARFGYSLDVKPVPVLDGVLLEYEVVPGA